MDAEEARLGAPRDPGLRGREHKGREGRRGRGGDPGDREEDHRRQGRHTEDEPAQVRQGGRHVRADLPERGLRAT